MALYWLTSFFRPKCVTFQKFMVEKKDEGHRKKATEGMCIKIIKKRMRFDMKGSNDY